MHKYVCELCSVVPTEYYEYQSCGNTETQNNSLSIKRIIIWILLFIFTIGLLLLIFSSNAQVRDKWTQTGGQILIGQYQIHEPLVAVKIAADFKRSLKKRPIIDDQTFYQNGEAICFYAKEKAVEAYYKDFDSCVSKAQNIRKV